MADARVEGPSLVVRGGPMDGYELKITEGLTVIVGAGRLANLRLDHPDIELAHVKVRWDETGLSMVDNGSRKGTWLNGVPVETAALLDGDVIEFTAPETKSDAPRVLLRVPAGSVPEPPPLPPMTPPAASAPEAPLSASYAARPSPSRATGRIGPRRGRVSPRRLALPDLRIVVLAASALVVLGLGAWGAKRLFFTAPRIASIQPPQLEPGGMVTITGTRFDHDPSRNLVWFGELRAAGESLDAGALRVRVPAAPAGRTPVRIENRRGRSAPFDFVVLTPLRASGLTPPGGLPGDEITLSGEGFSAEIAVTVDGMAAKVSAVEPGSLRFVVPSLTRQPGSSMKVVAALAARKTSPLPLVFGRLPLVLSVDPPQGTAGELVRIRGAGFADDLQSNAVTFDGVPALVVAASSRELAVVVPPLLRSLPEFRVPLAVRALGRTSELVSYPILRVEGRWVLRFVAAAVGAAGAQATIGTEIAPVLLLSSKDAFRAVATRALHLSALLNDAVDRALLGQDIVFEARTSPVVGLALVGSPDLLSQVTSEDAEGYAKALALPSGAEVSPERVASHWAAMLNDYLLIGTSAAKPRFAVAESPEAGAALAQLRTALPLQYGSGISSARVAALPASLREKLRHVAFTIP